MSAMSNYLEDALVNFVLRNNPDTFASPGTSIYVGLIKYYDAAVVEQGTLTQEASGGSYARVQVTAWDDPSGGGATRPPCRAGSVASGLLPAVGESTSRS